MAQGRLIVPGFNGGQPAPLVEFEFSPGLRAAGGGRVGRLADWSGQFRIESEALAQELDDHIAHNFEEGHSAVSEIVADGPDASYRLEGVALRYRGAGRFLFEAFSRTRI